jgi:hypothetical protein
MLYNVNVLKREHLLLCFLPTLAMPLQHLCIGSIGICRNTIVDTSNNTLYRIFWIFVHKQFCFFSVDSLCFLVIYDHMRQSMYGVFF